MGIECKSRVSLTAMDLTRQHCYGQIWTNSTGWWSESDGPSLFMKQPPGANLLVFSLFWLTLGYHTYFTLNTSVVGWQMPEKVWRACISHPKKYCYVKRKTKTLPLHTSKTVPLHSSETVPLHSLETVLLHTLETVLLHTRYAVY